MLALIFSVSLYTSKPAMLAFPDDGVDKPQSIRMAVVLPAPLAPRNPKISPSYTSKVISFAATKSPKRLVSLSVEITMFLFMLIE